MPHDADCPDATPPNCSPSRCLRPPCHSRRPWPPTNPCKVFILHRPVQHGRPRQGDRRPRTASLDPCGEGKEEVPATWWTPPGNWVARPTISALCSVMVRPRRRHAGRSEQRAGSRSATCKTIGAENSASPSPWATRLTRRCMLLKSCIGNRSARAGTCFPPGSERYEHTSKDKVYAGYKEKPDSWPADPAKGKDTPPPAEWLGQGHRAKPIDWYAGKQWDDDDVKPTPRWCSSDLAKYSPRCHPGLRGGRLLLLAGRKATAGNPAHAASATRRTWSHFIKTLRKEFNAPNAKFVHRHHG